MLFYHIKPPDGNSIDAPFCQNGHNQPGETVHSVCSALRRKKRVVFLVSSIVVSPEGSSG